jgi:DNA-binding NarL/FixJ family response regulator
MIRILLVDDHQIILDSLSFMFSSIPNIEISGSLSDSKKVIQFLENNELDIVVTDFNMPQMTGVDLTLQIKEKFHDVKVLLLTMVEDAPNIREAIKAGVDGYVLKKAGKDELEKAIRSIYAGKKYFSEAVIDELAASAVTDLNNTSPQTIHHLTSREIEILRLIAKELPSNQIAEKLFISMATVETHRRNLMQKLGVKTSIGMVKYAWKHGLVLE